MFPGIIKCPLGNKSDPIENQVPKAITKVTKQRPMCNKPKTEIKWNHKKISKRRKNKKREQRTEETNRKH